MNPVVRQYLQYINLPVAFILQLATAIFIVRSRQRSTFPVFFAYTIFHLIQSVLSSIAFHISYAVFFYEWWIGEMLDVFFALAAIQEIFLVTFQPYQALRHWASRIYVAGTLLLCTSAVLMAVQHPHGYSPRVAAWITLDRSALFVEAGLLFFLLAFCRLFGLSWRHYVFGIASGFVVMASVSTVAEALRTHFGVSVDSLVSILNAVSFTGAVAIWTYYFASARSRVALDHVPGTERLIAWNHALANVETIAKSTPSKVTNKLS